MSKEEGVFLEYIEVWRPQAEFSGKSRPEFSGRPYNSDNAIILIDIIQCKGKALTRGQWGMIDGKFRAAFAKALGVLIIRSGAWLGRFKEDDMECGRKVEKYKGQEARCTFADGEAQRAGGRKRMHTSI